MVFTKHKFCNLCRYAKFLQVQSQLYSDCVTISIGGGQSKNFAETFEIINFWVVTDVIDFSLPVDYYTGVRIANSLYNYTYMLILHS